MNPGATSGTTQQRKRGGGGGGGKKEGCVLSLTSIKKRRSLVKKLSNLFIIFPLSQFNFKPLVNTLFSGGKSSGNEAEAMASG